MSSKETSADKGAPKESSTPPAWDGKPVRITLLDGRGRHLGWVLFGGVGGLVLLLAFGAIGQLLGGVLAAIALQQSFRLAQTLMRPPGTFQVDGDSVQLPTGLCTGKELSLDRNEIDHVYFIRRSVPWTQAGPLLVIETGGKAYSFPRDWFSSDSEQRRVEMALNRELRLEAGA